MKHRAIGIACALIGLVAVESGAQAWKFDRFVNTPYPQPNSVSSGDMEVADLTGDGLADVLLIGTFKAKPGIFFYRQEKSGYVAVTGHGLPALHAGALIAAADFDADGDTDIAVMGKTDAANESALIKVFLNDGTGAFTPGADLGGQLPSEDFEDGTGAWKPDDKGVRGAVNANGWSQGLFEAADLNGDKLPDLIFAGAKGMEGGTDPAGQMIQRDWETGGVFLNLGKGEFKLVAKAKPDPDFCGAGFRKVNRGASALADFDGDGVLDLALFGQANLGPLANAGIPETQRNGQPVAEIWKGRGDGSFTPFPASGVTPMIDGAVRAADFNQDGKMDLVILGNTGTPKDPAGGRLLEVWLGKGDGGFAKDAAQIALKPLMNGGLALGDIDGDGDLDLVAAGNDNTRSLYVYENVGGLLTQKPLNKAKDGIGANTLNGSADTDASNSADLVLADMDRDGDLDLFLSGTGGVDQFLVFRNKLK
jgi:hypothetical protein